MKTIYDHYYSIVTDTTITTTLLAKLYYLIITVKIMYVYMMYQPSFLNTYYIANSVLSTILVFNTLFTKQYYKLSHISISLMRKLKHMEVNNFSLNNTISN